MAEQNYSWPSREKAKIIGKSHDVWTDSSKRRGMPKYTYDVNLKKQLIVKALGCPHAHCRVKSIDTSAGDESTRRRRGSRLPTRRSRRSATTNRLSGKAN